MIFNKHSELRDKHAILSPSKPFWLNYDRDQLYNFIRSQQAAAKGTKLHAFAASAIEEGYKLRGSTQTVVAYVNDGIGYGMTGPSSSWVVLHPAAKWVLAFEMMVGRLELFTVLVIFTRSFWKKD